MCDVSRLCMCVCLVSCGGSVEMVLITDEISEVRNPYKKILIPSLEGKIHLLECQSRSTLRIDFLNENT